MDISQEDIRALYQDKYGGDASADISNDILRLESGEPLAYVIGWIPFLGLRIELTSRPLIPRPETEWWTEKLISHIRERYSDAPFSFLDMCAGSGAIGLSILKEFPQASCTFVEIDPEHVQQIERNIVANGLDASRARVCAGDLFAPIRGERFSIIASNPPYIPSARALSKSVTAFEPAQALYAGDDGLSILKEIAGAAPSHVVSGGSVWLECDIDHIEAVRALMVGTGAIESTIHEDQYGRPRIVVSYYR